MDPEGITIISYNCRGLKSNIELVRNLCDRCDILLLQEHWLTVQELGLLNNIHVDFNGKGTAPVDLSTFAMDQHTGRPYGGVAILWRKMLEKSVELLDFDDDRIYGLNLSTRSILDNCVVKACIINVYMPYDCRDNNEIFVDYIGRLEACVNESTSGSVCLFGDFNADALQNKHNWRTLTNFCNANEYVMSDTAILPVNSFTYVSEAHSSVSWLDHIVSTHAFHSLIDHCEIFYDVAHSDHMPLACRLRVHCSCAAQGDTHTCGSTHVNGDVHESLSTVLPRWESATDGDLANYRALTEHRLANISVNWKYLLCINVNCDANLHRREIETVYNEVFTILHSSAETSVPRSTNARNMFTMIPGWNDYVRGYYDVSRHAFQQWVANNRPRRGPHWDAMRIARAHFKRAFRACKLHESEVRSTKMAEKIARVNQKDFWREVRKQSNVHTPLPHTVGDATGETQVSEMWRKHYENTYNLKLNTDHKGCIENNLRNMNLFSEDFRVRSDEVYDAIERQHRGKAAGADGIQAEHLIYAGRRICVILAMLFTAMVIHNFLPPRMICSILVPIVKNKTKLLSDANNYRPIALACVSSKIFENIILSRYATMLSSSDNQFGFKEAAGTELCIFSLKAVVNEYLKHDTPVFVVFLDASKAFDRINHDILFCKLLQRGLPLPFVRILYTWYKTQTMSVRWGNTLSSSFRVSNGVRQGGVLSPILFNLYNDELSTELGNCGVGCHIRNTLVNHLLYADDTTLFAPTSEGMNALLDICSKYGIRHDIVFNPAKSCCLKFFPPRLNAESNPLIKMNDDVIPYGTTHKYLGHVISSDASDSADIKNQMRMLCARGNSIVRNFRCCPNTVKTALFRAFCANFYCGSLWWEYRSGDLRNIKMAYNRVFRNLFKLNRDSSIRENLVLHNLPTFEIILRRSVYSLYSRVSDATVHQNRVVFAAFNVCYAFRARVRALYTS